MTISEWLQIASDQLTSSGFASSHLDAEIILAHTIDHPRTWLHAHGDDELELRKQEIADARLDLRLTHIPVAYIIGHKEFYGRRFSVTPQVLIPRADSEILIELLRDCIPSTHALGSIVRKHLVDIGTGSGCLGITAKLEHPELQVTLLDISQPALNVAIKNARHLNADVETLKSDLLSSFPYQPDIIVANLPYVDTKWERSEETHFEPAEALFASNDGLSLIFKCIDQASSRLKQDGYLVLEADPRQWNHIHQVANRSGFDLLRAERFGALYIKR